MGSVDAGFDEGGFRLDEGMFGGISKGLEESVDTDLAGRERAFDVLIRP